MKTSNMLRQVRRLERQLGPEPPKSATSRLPPGFMALKARASAAWCKRILEGPRPALENAQTSLVDAMGVVASFFDFEEVPADIAAGFQWHLDRVWPADGDPRREVPRGLATQLRALLRRAYLAARAEGMTDAEIAADEREHGAKARS